MPGLANFAGYPASGPSAGKRSDDLARLMGTVGEDYDYGMSAGAGTFGHYTDAGKLPWHPTFSTESKYASAKLPGGKWSVDGREDVFTPSQQMIQDGRANGLAAHMGRMNRFHEAMGHKGQYTKLKYPVPYKTPEHYVRP